jgi:hypothetical protein
MGVEEDVLNLFDFLIFVKDFLKKVSKKEFLEKRILKIVSKKIFLEKRFLKKEF